MKKLLLLILVISNTTFGAETEKTVKSKITSATVFLKGAQVNRLGNIALAKGKTTLKLSGLSPYVDKNSIKVKGIGAYTILSVNHSINFLEQSPKTPEKTTILNQIEKLKLDIEYKKTEQEILNGRKDFLITNKKILNNEKAISPTDFKLFKEIYSSDFENIQISILKKQREIDGLNKQIQKLNQQIKENNTQKDLPTSEIRIVVSTKAETKGKISVSYFVDNAGWYPSYDLRVGDINSPVKLVYKANVFQNTGIDWKNIKLTFSNATPDESANIPVLSPYYLGFNNYAPKVAYGYYDPNVREVNGILRDSETGESIPFATIVVKGTTVGTTSDFDGNFSLAIPRDAKALTIAFVGYETAIVPISGPYLNITLKASAEMMDEIVVTAMGISRGSRKRKPAKEKSANIPKTKVVSYQTNFELSIDVPYTLKANANKLTIEMKDIELNTSYIYQAVPKITPKAFLIANITDWEQHNLLDGEVNLYFENTFVGKSILDLTQMSDTLEVSLGPDKGITIKRIKEKDLSSRQFLGGNKIESRVWKTTIRNNKSEKVKLLVFDQIPISNDEDITVDVQELSDGKMNTESGEVVWEIEIEPKETIEKTISYKVKYPKKKFLRIE